MGTNASEEKRQKRCRNFAFPITHKARCIRLSNTAFRADFCFSINQHSAFTTKFLIRAFCNNFIHYIPFKKISQ